MTRGFISSPGFFKGCENLLGVYIARVEAKGWNSPTGNLGMECGQQGN